VKPSPVPPAATAIRPPRKGQTLKFLAVAVFLAVVLPLVFLSGLLAWHQYRVLYRWPAVDAVVTKVDWTTTTVRSSRAPITSYGLRFTFRYLAGGREYSSSVDLGYTSTSRTDVERWAAQMPVGSHHRIRYDPNHPNSVSLADYTPDSFAAPLALFKWAGASTLVAVVLFYLGWRAAKVEGKTRGQESA